MAQQFEALLAGSLRGTELGASVLGVATCFRHGRSPGSMEPEETAVGRGGAIAFRKAPAAPEHLTTNWQDQPPLDPIYAVEPELPAAAEVPAAAATPAETQP